MRTIGYLYIPELLGPPDPQDQDRLQAAGADEVFVDWGARHTYSQILKLLEEGGASGGFVSVGWRIWGIPSPRFMSASFSFCRRGWI
ncbi:MAG: hypothetical protein HC921_08550 [Synechococcaceae cyanobacterium SM2_3_1]|nr:hypothetical protein [Synechococcaceae cyanobacterium SM2_3_1]